jgi:nitrogen fixation NifU-like protein
MNGSAESDEWRDLYRELILDHARSPRNFRRLPNATHTAEGINPLCGDKLHLDLVVDADNRVADIGFDGSGCAISMASASLLTETVANLSVAEAEACFEAVSGRLTGAVELQSVPGVDLSKLRALDGVREYPTRIKCATLAWHALHAAIGNNTAVTATTE